MTTSMQTVLITGVTGILGSPLAERLSCQGYTVIGMGRSDSHKTRKRNTYEYIKADILDTEKLKQLLNDKQPDVIIHCAGIAHQKAFCPCSDLLYDQVNHQAAVELAKIAGSVNPNLFFIFLSSMNVYGEHGGTVFDENMACHPDGAYAESKLSAELGLSAVFESGCIRKLDILRLAPVYSATWKLNLEKRICGPGKLFYVRYGSGRQRLSILSRRNLLDFIRFRIKSDGLNSGCNVINVSDLDASSFGKLIEIMNAREMGRRKRVLTIPINVVKLTADILGYIYPERKAWIHSCYLKLSKDIVVNNQRMLETGFKPVHSLESVFNTRQR